MSTLVPDTLGTSLAILVNMLVVLIRTEYDAASCTGFQAKCTAATLGFSAIMGVKLIGSSNSGGASTSDFEIEPVVGMFTFWYCVTSTCSWPRCTCALPLDTTISLSLVSLSNFTAARL